MAFRKIRHRLLLTSNYVLLLIAILHVLTISLAATDEILSNSSLVRFLFLGIITVPSVIFYFDLNHIGDDLWDPYFGGALWVFGSFLPFVSPSVLITYLCRRHENVNRKGKWAGWPIVVVGSIVTTGVAVMFMILFINPAVEYTTFLEGFGVFLLLSVSSLPIFTTYFDLRFLGRTDEYDVSWWEWLWMLVLSVWGFQYLFLPLWLFWRSRIPSAPGYRQILTGFDITDLGINLPSRSKNITSQSATENNGDTSSNQTQTHSKDTQSVKEIYTEAESLVEAAETADENGELEKAVEDYTTAQKKLEQIDRTEDNLTDNDAQHVADGLNTVEQRLTDVTERYEKQSTVFETLEDAERSFQEGIAGYLNEDQTLSRVRFRQARNGFEKVIDLVENSSETLLDQSVTVTPNPQQQLPAVDLEEFSQLTEKTIEGLQVVNAETVADISIEDDSIRPSVLGPITHSEDLCQDEITVLTMLSWWDEEESVEFETVADIDRRLEQAKLGFAKS